MPQVSSKYCPSILPYGWKSLASLITDSKPTCNFLPITGSKNLEAKIQLYIACRTDQQIRRACAQRARSWTLLLFSNYPLPITRLPITLPFSNDPFPITRWPIALYTLHCTLYTAHYYPWHYPFPITLWPIALYTLQCTLCTVHPFPHFPYYPLHCILYTVHCTLHTVYCIMYTLHSIQYISILYNVYCILYTV